MCLLDLNLFDRSAVAPFLGGGIVVLRSDIPHCYLMRNGVVIHPSVDRPAQSDFAMTLKTRYLSALFELWLVFLCVTIPHYKLRVDQDETAHKGVSSMREKPANSTLNATCVCGGRPRRHLRSTLKRTMWPTNTSVPARLPSSFSSRGSHSDFTALTHRYL